MRNLVESDDDFKMSVRLGPVIYIIITGYDDIVYLLYWSIQV